MIYTFYSYAVLCPYYDDFILILGLQICDIFNYQTDDLQDHIIICGFGRVGQVLLCFTIFKFCFLSYYIMMDKGYIIIFAHFNIFLARSLRSFFQRG